MLKGKEILLLAGASVGILMLVATFYLLFQNEPFYKATLGHITKNYRNDGNSILKDRVPYERFAEEKMYNWDAAHYRKIADHGYSVQAAGGDYIFAFFPLFPFLWKTSGLNAIQISLLNYFFYTASLIILILLFAGKEPIQKWRYLLVLAGIPLMVVFLIPYTEGLFMFTMSLALWGILKNRYMLYFAGALLTSLTRQAVSVLVLSFFFTELYFLFHHKQFTRSLRSFTLKILPIVAGTALVSIIQSGYGSNHLLKFIEVEKYWGYKLQWPGIFTDWAHEQFCTNLPLITIVLPLLILLITHSTIKTLFCAKQRNDSNSLHITEKENTGYVYLLSVIYIVGICLVILFFRGGSLNGLSRYVFCTPFFAIFLFMLAEKVGHLRPLIRIAGISTAVILSMLAFKVFTYSANWNFSDLGFFLFFFQIAFFIFTKMISNNWVLSAFTFLTALWTSYLFSMFISNAWIIT